MKYIFVFICTKTFSVQLTNAFGGDLETKEKKPAVVSTNYHIIPSNLIFDQSRN